MRDEPNSHGDMPTRSCRFLTFPLRARAYLISAGSEHSPHKPPMRLICAMLSLVSSYPILILLQASLTKSEAEDLSQCSTNLTIVVHCQCLIFILDNTSDGGMNRTEEHFQNQHGMHTVYGI